jgi:hypothetical protein
MRTSTPKFWTTSTLSCAIIFHLAIPGMIHDLSLPNELWEKIFAAAFTDEGKTGCVLSMVSKHFRGLSERTRLQSVAIYSLTSLRTFSKSLSAGAYGNLTIRCLLLMKPRPSNHEDYGYGEEVEWDDIYQELIPHIAPTLEVLAFIDFNLFPRRLASDGLQFPRLRDLIMRGSASTLTPGPLLPSLQRAHLYGWVGLCDIARLSDFTQSIKQLYISLVGLRLSNPETLGALLGVNSDPHGPSPLRTDFSEKLSKSLVHVSVELFRRRPFSMRQREDEDAVFREAMPIFLKLMNDPQTAGRLNVCPLREQPEYDGDALRLAWLNLVKGGDGTWQTG